MSFQINSVEVLAYLNELGFKNISCQQLKEFMHDLKKLIKYDLKKKQFSDNDQNFGATSTPTPLEINKLDIFEHLYLHETESWKAKKMPKRERLITVEVRWPRTAPVNGQQHHKNDLSNDEILPHGQILEDKNLYDTEVNPKSQMGKHSRTSNGKPLKKRLKDKSTSDKNIHPNQQIGKYNNAFSEEYRKERTVKHKNTSHNENHVKEQRLKHIDTSDKKVHSKQQKTKLSNQMKHQILKNGNSIAPPTSLDEKLKESQKCVCESAVSHTLKPKRSFIRPCHHRCNIRYKKNDPVSLYHYYKEGWDKSCIPGQYNKAEANLRWAIREQMASCPTRY